MTSGERQSQDKSRRPRVVSLFSAPSRCGFESFSHGSAVPERETLRPRPQILRCNLYSDPPSQLPHLCLGRNPKVSSAGGRFGLSLSLPFYLCPTGGTASQIPSVSGHHLHNPDVDESKPGNISSRVVDPTPAYENKPSWKPTVHASAGLAVDVLKESSDAFTPLKSVVGGLSVVLKYYDVRYPCLTKP